MDFSSLLTASWPELSAAQHSKMKSFFDLVVAENEIQNLTRLISPQDFVDGHLIDVKELLKSNLLSGPVMDLGSGGGIPGIPCAILTDYPWILVDSEGRKAEFLTRAALELGLENVTAFGKRAEEVLKTSSVGSIVARAVGPVDRIYGWLRNCSTWNNLVLLKGPGWDEEWSKFLLTSHRKDLEVTSIHEYVVGVEQKHRKIVRLKRLRGGKN